MSLKKPRADAKLLNLPEEQQEQLVAWLFSAGMTYQQARALVRREFGVTCSLAALSAFWSQVCAPRLVSRRSQSAAAAEQIAAEARKNGGVFTDATLAMLRQKAFDLLADSHANPEDVRGLLSLALKARDQDQKGEQIAQAERRLKLLETRDEKARATLGDTTLTPEQQTAKFREIFGLAA